MFQFIKKDREFYKTLISIGLPIVIQNFMFSLVNMVDTAMIGQLGEAQIGGVGVANRLFFLFNLMIFGINSGGAIFIAQYWGIKDVKNIRRVLGINLALSVIGSLIFMCIAWFVPEWFISRFNDDPEIVLTGTKYLRIISFSYLITAISFSFTFALRSIGKSVVPMITNVVALCTNIIFNAIFIFGLLGLPAMGASGAALGTVIARSIEIVLLLTIIYKVKGPLAGKINEFFDWNKQLISKVIEKAAPVVANEIFWSIGVTVYGVFYGQLGKYALAATTILSTIEQLGMVMFFGIGSACAVMLGNALGNNEKDKAWDYSVKLVKLSFILAVLIAILLIGFTPLYLRVYDVEPIVIEYIKGCIIIYACLLPFKVFNGNNVVGILRSGGDTIFALILDLVGVWGVGVPLGALAVYVLGLDLYYVYFFVLSEELVKFVIGIFRYRSKKWMNNLVEG